jgi:hypothetical protein
MTSERPPAIAVWLLQRFAASTWSDALVGDLVEEYGRGRSRAWFWRQAVAVIAANVRMEIAGHKLLAVRAIVAGFASFALFTMLMVRLAMVVIAPRIPASWWAFHAAAPRPVDVIAAVLMCVASFGSGWVVGRLHRAHHAAMFLAYLAAFAVWMLVMLTVMPQRVAQHSYGYNLTAWTIVLSAYTLSVAIGGLCSAPSRHRLTFASDVQ